MSRDLIASAGDWPSLLGEVRACRRCTQLPLGPNPIVQFHPRARILIAGQAPGRITHGKGVPFDDPSGDRLRSWMGIDREMFYKAEHIAILPMAFCYPGTGRSGDLPPPLQCAEHWRDSLLAALPAIELTLVIGRYAIDWHLPDQRGQSLTATVARWQHYWPSVLPLPHPSPRNNRWLKNNPWFEAAVIPVLQQQVAGLLG